MGEAVGDKTYKTSDVEYDCSFGDTNEIGVALVEHYWLWKTSQTFIKLFCWMMLRGIYFDWGFGGDFGAKKLQLNKLTCIEQPCRAKVPLTNSK